MPTKFSIVPLLATVFVLTAGTALAERGSTSGYVSDSTGNIVGSGAGDCVHSGSWSKSKATVVGCDDYALDAPIEIIKGEGLDAITLVSFPQAELFAFDSAELSADGKAYIRENRKELGDDLAQAYSVTVIGYTDSTGDASYNMDLSKRRAQAVADFLVSLDVPGEKMRVMGRGENDPVASNDSRQGRAQNRRVEVIVVGQPRALDAMIFPSVALFERRSAELTSQGIVLLEQNIKDARDQLRRAAYIEIVGHTDDVGDDDYNQELSEKRARAVGEYLAGIGVDASKILMLGMGETQPIASNATDTGRAENRRVEVLVLGRTR